MPYRSAERAVANALEEQREILALERDRKLRRVRAACVLSAIFLGLVGFIELLNSGPRQPRLMCHQEGRIYEPSAEGRVPRPPDTWTSCEWR